MIDLGPHAAFIWSAYADRRVVMAGSSPGCRLGRRAAGARLADLEARGVTRRSRGFGKET